MHYRKLRASLISALASFASVAIVSGIAWAQPAEDPAAPDTGQPAPDEVPADAPAADPNAPVDDTVPADPMPDDGVAPTDEPMGEPSSVEVSSLTVHIVSTRNTYETMAFDIFDTATEQVVATGRGADEAAGEQAPTFQLPPGTYKIVKSGEPYGTRVDFATVQVDGPTNYVIVIDPQTGDFRGAGLVTGELPEGQEIAGIRIALNVGGSLNFNQEANVVGTTNGVSALLGLFGNFSMVFDKGNHFLKVDSQLALTVRDPETADAFSTQDYFTGSALYAFNINNPFVGPYARFGFQTKVFPGYLYLEEEDAATGVVNVNRLDGSVETYTFGGEANTDDLRIKLADAFAPLILQEEIGGNLKAADIDLRLFDLSVATRLGFGFRQGITNGLLVVEGDERGTPVNLFEVDNYNTLGPVAGATATVTFARWLFGSGELGMMAPLKDYEEAGDNFGERLLIDLAATGGLKFPSLSFFYATIDYTLRLQRDGFLTDDTQFAHSIMARGNLQLF